MKLSPKPYYIVLFIVLTILGSSLYNAHAGFSVELIHRDSLKSSFYIPAETHYERLQKALTRSIARAKHMAARMNQEINPSDPKLNVEDHGFEYLMTLSLGTPPFQVTGIMDTSTSLLWTQCAPCAICYGQMSLMYDPSKSSTYRKMPCNASECKLVPGNKCDGDTCSYEVTYGALTTNSSVGQMGFDTFTVDTISGGRIAFTGGLIGCGSKSEAPAFEEPVSGVFGLGPGPASILKQMGDHAGEMFSYCLIPIGKVSARYSIIHFGHSAIVSRLGTVSTPLYYHDYYWVTLEGVTVGSKRIDSPKSSELPGGNTVVDTSTVYTFVQEKLYNEIVSAIKEYTLAPADESGDRLCYRADQLNAPPITIHFKDADVELSVENTFIKVEENLMCLAFRKSPNNLLSAALYGSFMQMNFWVQFDLPNKLLSFSRKVDCSQEV